MANAKNTLHYTNSIALIHANFGTKVDLLKYKTPTCTVKLIWKEVYFVDPDMNKINYFNIK